jgi:hypothetical protein
MPASKNGTGFYKGTEKSPKGLGYNAHNYKQPGARKFGLDGKMWVVHTRSTGSLYWEPLSTNKKRSFTKPKRKSVNRKLQTAKSTRKKKTTAKKESCVRGRRKSDGKCKKKSGRKKGSKKGSKNNSTRKLKKASKKTTVKTSCARGRRISDGKCKKKSGRKKGSKNNSTKVGRKT